MGLSTAERNKRKRERKKLAREAIKKQEEQTAAAAKEQDKQETAPEIEIEYVAEELALPSSSAEDSSSAVLLDQLKKFQARASVGGNAEALDQNSNSKGVLVEEEEPLEGDDDDELVVSKRKLREKLRPTVAELKRRVDRPDLVEAHDITATDPDFLIQLKAAPGTVPVPRHWGRKRKYLQGKRGFEKPPFKLPDFIVNTGITEIRDTVAEAENSMSAKQKNRARVAPKMGAIDVDYRTLHDAFFKYQTKPSNLTKFGDLYYEGKELEVDIRNKSTGKLSKRLREALGMVSETAPPPWLLNMQRYGPPPSYPGLKVAGLTAPLPSEECQYGFHPGGWGKPPVDPYGRPLYGGNPFEAPGAAAAKDDGTQTLVTSDGKMVAKAAWGELPEGVVEDEEEEEEQSSEEEEEDDDMQDSDEEEGEEPAKQQQEEGTVSILPPPPMTDAAPGNLRKQDGGVETPAVPPKALYQVLEQKRAGQQAGAVFNSEVTYAVPAAPEAGAESVLSKALPTAKEHANKRKRQEDEDEDDMGKNFKF